MSDTAKLLIPMYVEALVLRNDQNKMTDIRPQIKKISGSFLGKTIQPNGNQSVEQHAKSDFLAYNERLQM